MLLMSGCVMAQEPMHKSKPVTYEQVTKMNHDISKPVPQGSNGAQDAENSRIAAIANELERLCAVHEAQPGDCQQNVSRIETEQRASEKMAKANGYWIPMTGVQFSPLSHSQE